MLKKRLIFTLLYCNGQFMLSRNFRLQQVGNIEWLRNNYNFAQVSYSIDELIVLDVSPGERDVDKFCDSLKLLTEGCFVPIAAGGGLASVDSARKLLRSGADKVVVNSELFVSNSFVDELASEFGKQCIIGSIDIKSNSNGDYQVWSRNGTELEPGLADSWIKKISNDAIGEIYLNSIDRDGTGQGLDLDLLDMLPTDMKKPVILAGGVGSANHISEGLDDPRVDAVATANLFNFIGDGLKNARNSIISKGTVLPLWSINQLDPQPENPLRGRVS